VRSEGFYVNEKSTVVTVVTLKPKHALALLINTGISNAATVLKR